MRTRAEDRSPRAAHRRATGDGGGVGGARERWGPGLSGALEIRSSVVFGKAPPKILSEMGFCCFFGSDRGFGHSL